MFIIFHFKFIQQHFCRALFVEIWDILRVDYHVISAFVSAPAAMSFYLFRHYGLVLRVLCHNTSTRLLFVVLFCPKFNSMVTIVVNILSFVQ